MRIIITPKGELELKNLGNYTKTLTRNKSYSIQTPFTISNRFEWYKNDPLSRSSTTTTLTSPKAKLTLVDINERMNKDDIIHNAKKVIINKPKMAFAKNMFIKYDMVTPEETIKNQSRNTQLFAATIRSNSNSNCDHQRMTLKNIFKPEAIQSMKKSVIKEEKERKQLLRLTKDNFRSIYTGGITKINQLNNMLTKEIYSDKDNLINYLGEKEHVSPLSVLSLSCANNDEIIRKNKICQIISENNQERAKHQELIQKTIIAIDHNRKLKYMKSMKIATHEMKTSNNILDKYKTKVSHDGQYREILQDTKKYYWNKYNLDRLYGKNQGLASSVIDDNEEGKKCKGNNN